MDKFRGRILTFFDPTSSIPLLIVGTTTLTQVLQACYVLANDPKVCWI